MRTPASPLLTIEHALLGFIYERPVHGYEIYQQLVADDGLRQVWRLKQGQLYALLAKLEEHDYVTSDVQLQAARPPRKIYSLTAKGCSAFEDWLHTPVTRGRQMRMEFLAKLYFARRQNSAVVANLLSQQAAACEHWLADLHRQSPVRAQQDLFVYAVHQFRINQVETFLAWLAACQVYGNQDAAQERMQSRCG